LKNRVHRMTEGSFVFKRKMENAGTSEERNRPLNR
jgi:hypothetical protein